MSSLFVIRGRDQGKRFELGRQSTSIGRDSENTIQLYDTEVSRFHAEIRPDQDDFVWVDNGSSNGSFVNSFRTEQHKLRSGDRIQIGRTLMIFTASSELSATMTSDEVDIIGQARSTDGSRIIKSVSHEAGSQILSGTDEGGGPWLARVRSNLQIMYRTALAVSHTLDIDQLLERIMELIFEWVEADRGCVMLVDRESDALVPRVRRDRRDSTQNDKLEISKTILDYVQTKQEGVLTSNAREDDRWDGAASIVKLGVREAMCVPMQGRYDMVGVIYIDTFTPPDQFIQKPARNKFNEEHLKLMVAIGHQAALAVEDTSYYSAMVQAERLAAVGQTIASLSHHIKNILQGIRGGSYLIEEGLKLDDNDVTRKGWGIVEKNQERISRLVMDMLTFSKERKPDLTPSDLNDVVQEVVDLMAQRAKDQNIKMEFRPFPSIPTMSFDSEGIHRAALNIVTNAIDACEENDEITIETSYDEDDRLLRVVVKDSGCGISPEMLPKLFTVFSSDKGNRGTGLGLAVSQKIIREHGGDIQVTSNPGSGSCFTIVFPAVVAETSS